MIAERYTKQKKTGFLLIVFIVFVSYLIISGCYILPQLPDWVISEDFNSLEEGLSFIAAFHYISGSVNDWNTPEETYKRRGGDCSDLSLLLVHIMYEKLGLHDARVVFGYYNGFNHAWVSLRNVWYEPQWGYEIEKEFLNELYRYRNSYSYHEALRIASYR